MIAEGFMGERPRPKKFRLVLNAAAADAIDALYAGRSKNVSDVARVLAECVTLEEVQS